MPGYVNDYAKLSEAGAQVIVCVSVNDPFVMEAWGKQTGAEAKVSWAFHILSVNFSGNFAISVMGIVVISHAMHRMQGIRMLADTHGKLAKALDLELDMAAALGMKRMKR